MTDVNNTLDAYNDLGRVNIVDAAIAQDKDAFMSAFNNAIAQKVSDALEVKKVEVASSLINSDSGAEEVATQEVETSVATEVTNEP
jgi:hypothetical protein